MMYKYFAILLILVSLTCSCSTDGEYRYASGSTWGTTYHIKYKSQADLTDSIVAVMRAIDMSLSPFEKSSQISAINRGERVKADSMLCEVLSLSKKVNALSGGMFDPTVAPLINLWGFGYTEGEADCPTQEQIDEALLSVGINDCFVDDEGNVVRKSPDTQFNFSAIAKGYGIDCIASMLRRCGCTDYMVEIGGEMSVSGVSPSGTPWRIQVDAPVVDAEGDITHSALKIIEITDAGIATSGNYRNHRSTSKGEVGHTISPVTGKPVSSNTLSATVIAPTAALADALATSIMAMPDSLAIAMMQSLPDTRSMIVKTGDAGIYQLVYTGDFESLLSK